MSLSSRFAAFQSSGLSLRAAVQLQHRLLSRHSPPLRSLCCARNLTLYSSFPVRHASFCTSSVSRKKQAVSINESQDRILLQDVPSRVLLIGADGAKVGVVDWQMAQRSVDGRSQTLRCVNRNGDIPVYKIIVTQASGTVTRSNDDQASARNNAAVTATVTATGPATFGASAGETTASPVTVTAPVMPARKPREQSASKTKENEAKQFTISWHIGEHDMAHRLRRAEETLQAGVPVQIVLGEQQSRGVKRAKATSIVQEAVMQRVRRQLKQCALEFKDARVLNGQTVLFWKLDRSRQEKTSNVELSTEAGSQTASQRDSSGKGSQPLDSDDYYLKNVDRILRKKAKFAKKQQFKAREDQIVQALQRGRAKRTQGNNKDNNNNDILRNKPKSKYKSRR